MSAKRKRNYRREYDTYHGTADQRKKRSNRNKARRILARRRGKSAVKGKEVDHKDGNPLNNSVRNLRAISRRKNRKKQ